MKFRNLPILAITDKKNYNIFETSKSDEIINVHVRNIFFHVKLIKNNLSE